MALLADGEAEGVEGAIILVEAPRAGACVLADECTSTSGAFWGEETVIVF